MIAEELDKHVTLEAAASESVRVGELARARELLEKALSCKEKKFGAEHREVARTLVKLADVMGGLGLPAERRDLMDKVVWVQEWHYSYSSDFQTLISAVSSLAEAYTDLGDTCKASDLLERAKKIKDFESRFALSERYMEDSQILSLASRDLCILPPEMRDFSSLVVLDLSRNRLTELPLEIEGLRTLESLDVSRNRLQILPTGLGQLSRLRQVNAFGNHLKAVERSIPLAEFSALEHFSLLDLRCNPKLKEAAARSSLAARLPAVSVLLSGAAPLFPQKQFAADRDPRMLQSQLEPYPLAQLCARLREFGGEVDVENAERWWVMDRLLERYAAMGPRSVRKVRGVAGTPELLDLLLEELRQTKWPSENERERKKIHAEGYIILARPFEDRQNGSKKALCAAAKLQRHARVWDLAQQLMMEVDVDFASRWTALAMTKHFVGSPHIDVDNVGPFYGLALGDFEGGAICVEGSPFEVIEVDTRRRLGKVDGRFPHWVAPYTGERYSLIFYQTWGEEIPQTTAVFEPEGAHESKRCRHV